MVGSSTVHVSDIKGPGVPRLSLTSSHLSSFPSTLSVLTVSKCLRLPFRPFRATHYILQSGVHQNDLLKACSGVTIPSGIDPATLQLLNSSAQTQDMQPQDGDGSSIRPALLAPPAERHPSLRSFDYNSSTPVPVAITPSPPPDDIEPPTPPPEPVRETVSSPPEAIPLKARIERAITSSARKKLRSEDICLSIKKDFNPEYEEPSDYDKLR